MLGKPDMLMQSDISSSISSSSATSSQGGRGPPKPVVTLTFSEPDPRRSNAFDAADGVARFRLQTKSPLIGPPKTTVYGHDGAIIAEFKMHPGVSSANDKIKWGPNGKEVKLDDMFFPVKGLEGETCRGFLASDGREYVWSVHDHEPSICYRKADKILMAVYRPYLKRRDGTVELGTLAFEKSGLKAFEHIAVMGMITEARSMLKEAAMRSLKTLA